MRRLMLTRVILAHFLRLANFKRRRRSSAVVSLVLVQHLTMSVRHQPKTGLFFPKPLVSSLPPSYYSDVSSFMSTCESTVRVSTASFIQVIQGTTGRNLERDRARVAHVTQSPHDNFHVHLTAAECNIRPVKTTNDLEHNVNFERSVLDFQICRRPSAQRTPPSPPPPTSV